MRGRRVPPIVVVAPPFADDPSQDADAAFFRRNPHLTEYTRPYLPGETPEPMPQGTLVHVKRSGATRLRGFAPPTDLGGRN